MPGAVYPLKVKIKCLLLPIICTYTSLSVSPNLVLSVTATGLDALSKGLHATLKSAPVSSTAHVALVCLKAATLVRRLLHTSGVNQMEGGLILVVVVSILAARAKLRSILVWNN